MHFITARHVSVENLQHGTLAWGYRNKAVSAGSLYAGFTLLISVLFGCDLKLASWAEKELRLVR